MPGKTWRLQTEDGIHTVEIRHGWFSPREYVCVDSVLVSQATKWLGLSSVHHFDLDGHIAAAYIKSNGRTFDYDLAIDGISVETDEPVIEPQRLPLWAWLFIPLSLAGPLVGFAVSGTTLDRDLVKWVGVTAVGLCMVMILDRTKVPSERIKRGAIVTVLAWVLPLVIFLGSRYFVS